MDTETSRQYEQSLFIRHTNNPKITTYVLQQNIFNQTQEQRSHANIYTVQHKTNLVVKKIHLAYLQPQLTQR